MSIVFNLVVWMKFEERGQDGEYNISIQFTFFYGHRFQTNKWKTTCANRFPTWGTFLNFHHNLRSHNPAKITGRFISQRQVTPLTALKSWSQVMALNNWGLEY